MSSLLIERGYCSHEEDKDKISPGSVYGNRLAKMNKDEEDLAQLVYANKASLYVISHYHKSNDKMDDKDDLEMSKHDKIPIPIPFEEKPNVGKIDTPWQDSLEKEEICEVSSQKDKGLVAAINRSGQSCLYKYSEDSISSHSEDLEEYSPRQKRKLSHQGFSICTTFSNVPKFQCAIDPDHASVKFMPGSNTLATSHRFSREIKFLDMEKQVEHASIMTQAHINTLQPLCSNTIAVAEHNRLVIYDIRAKTKDFKGNNTSKHCYQRVTNSALWQHDEIHTIAKSPDSSDYNIAFAGSERSVQLIDQRKWTITYKWQPALKYDVNYIDLYGDFCVSVGFTHPEIRACYLSKNQSGQAIHAPARFIGCTGLYSLGKDQSTTPYRLDVLTIDGEVFSLNNVEASI